MQFSGLLFVGQGAEKMRRVDKIMINAKSVLASRNEKSATGIVNKVVPTQHNFELSNYVKPTPKIATRHSTRQRSASRFNK
jgi:hypothetical protein